MSAQTAFRWGIIGTGNISTKFAHDVLVDPSTRSKGEQHAITAVGSRNTASAQTFIDALPLSAESRATIEAHGSYDSLLSSPSIDAVYIGTPHSGHYAVALAALRTPSLRAVLVEKPGVCSRAEWLALERVAEEEKTFLMEAMWTAFQPLARVVRDALEGGGIGKLHTVQADLSIDMKPDALADTHRMLDPLLAGGALLDLGPYPMVWAVLAAGAPGEFGVKASMVKARTGVDLRSAWILDFGGDIQAVLSASMDTPSLTPSVILRGARGSIRVYGQPYCPTHVGITLGEEEEVFYGAEGKLGSAPPPPATQEAWAPGSDIAKAARGYEGAGWHFQADDVARSVRANLLQSSVWPWKNTSFVMGVFDQVRSQGGYVFPEGVLGVVE
ncbi:NAD(P)-binding protein [Cylindrobasidium torrendii FP15055 ss-10]|uniref:D-xylose 1-dehydrogenase (NADP(+), D-xylono-1,5-lactone-forming) n=1 Tax=Cylindrobasidium torrendii FP15055 ss-10 TaxID=1314674 RepID=A0A0D7AUA4_9AGAR|nr:NAD(P)-binding protein [Cylindrobasidium torrendii FP15055 ss-10]